MCTLLSGFRWPQDNDIDKLHFKCPIHFTAVCALASDEIKLFQSIAKETPNMSLKRTQCELADNRRC